MNRKWPRLEYLVTRHNRYVEAAWAEAHYQREVLEERRRAEEGVRIQSLAEFQEGLSKGRILGRIPGILHAWSEWITPTREFIVNIFDTHGGESFSTLLDMRGQPIGLFERETFRLDHFVSWDEFLACYQLWSTSGIPPRDEEGPREEGDDAVGPLVIAPLDAMQEGRFPAQPNDGKFESDIIKSILPRADLQGELESSQQNPNIVVGQYAANGVPVGLHVGLHGLVRQGRNP